MNKKRKKVELLHLPGQQNPQPNPFQQNYPNMEVDPTDDKNSSNIKWPGKRGARGQKESL